MGIDTEPSVLADDSEDIMVAIRAEQAAAAEAEEVDGVGVKRRFGPHSLEVCASHEQVCTAVKTGTRRVERPDPAAPTITVVEDVVEWHCPPSLLNPEKTA